MTTAQLLQIFVGKPVTVGHKNAAHPMDREWTSGIFKHPVDGPVWLGKTNLQGDGQADLSHHGGPEKAVLAYADVHYDNWREELKIPEMSFGAFGENFVVSGQTEQSVCIGDTYRVGDAVIQVSQPRQPCWKPARRWRVKDLALKMQQSGRTGWYFRVLEEGYVAAGQHIALLERPFPEWTIDRCNIIMHEERHNREQAAKLAACPLLSKNWVKTLTARATMGKNPDPKARLIGPNEALF